MQLFYTRNISGQNAILTDDEARHVKVLRKNVNDVLNLIDGKGQLYEARITGFSDNRKNFEVILEIHSNTLQSKKRDYYSHLYIAPTKQNERIEWMFEKAIESGLDEITFIQTEHSEKSRLNTGRLEKIAISAMKQSGEFYQPIINEMKPYPQIFTNEKSEYKLIAHCNDQFEKTSMKELFMNHKPSMTISILIGPEGDFSNKEISMAYENGYKGLSLGNTRLRTETAGLYAVIGLSIL